MIFYLDRRLLRWKIIILPSRGTDCSYYLVSSHHSRSERKWWTSTWRCQRWRGTRILSFFGEGTSRPSPSSQTWRGHILGPRLPVYTPKGCSRSWETYMMREGTDSSHGHQKNSSFSITTFWGSHSVFSHDNQGGIFDLFRISLVREASVIKILFWNIIEWMDFKEQKLNFDDDTRKNGIRYYSAGAE